MWFSRRLDRRLLRAVAALIVELEDQAGWDEERWLPYLEALDLTPDEADIVRKAAEEWRAIRGFAEEP